MSSMTDATKSESSAPLLRRLIEKKCTAAELKGELEKRQLEFNSRARRAELAETLRVAIEQSHGDTPGFSSVVAELRDEELQMTIGGGYDRDNLQAKLKVRGLDASGARAVLEERLCETLQEERDRFHSETFATPTKGTDAQTPAAPSNVIGSTLPSPTKPEITYDQRRRMEENRKRALAKKAELATKRLKQSLPIPAAAAASPTTKIGTPSNPYKQKEATKTPSPTTSKTITPLSYRKTTHHYPACARCSLQADPNTLCIIWRHKGDLQRERTFSGWDAFRYECCGNLDPSPCFLGRHALSPSEASRPLFTTASCHCHDRARVRRTKKTGYNQGRLFYTCGSTGPDSCNFFQWVDEAFGLPPQPFRSSFDGVKEDKFLFPNPFSEKLCSQTEAMKSPEQRRRRLVAAVLLRGMYRIASGETGFVSGSTMAFRLFPDATRAWKEEGDSGLADCLHPLTMEQIVRRFGPIASLLPPTDDECKGVLNELLERNSLVRSLINIELLPPRPPTFDEKDLLHIDLGGLGNYLQL